MKKSFNDIFLLIILFIGNIFINEQKYYFLLIYVFILLNHLYIYTILSKNNQIQNYELQIFLFISLFSFVFTYFIILEPNPIFSLLSFYTFYPNFIKGIFIIFMHSYVLYYYISQKKRIVNLKSQEESSSKFKLQIKPEYYFLASFFNSLIQKSFYKNFIIGLILFFSIEVIIFSSWITLLFFSLEVILPHPGNFRQSGQMHSSC